MNYQELLALRLGNSFQIGPVWPNGNPDFDENFAAAYSVIAACEAGLNTGTGETEAFGDLTSSTVDQENTCLVRSDDGTALAVAIVEIDQSGESVYVDAYVNPERALAIWSELLRAGQDLTQQLGSNWQLKTGSYAHDERYIKVLRECGYEPVRTFWRMVIDVSQAQPPGLLPAECEVQSIHDDDFRRAMWLVTNESFAEHFDFTRRTYDEWLPLVLGLPGADEKQWTLIRVGDEPAAALIGDDSRLERRSGYVRSLGVRSEFRGRGLARWLLLHYFADARARGLAEVRLTVDSANETGATALYESVGMQPEQVLIAWKWRR